MHWVLVYAENANTGNAASANSPKTGDETNMLLSLALAMLSVAVGFTVFAMKRKAIHR